jgi:flagellar basal body-associated protein FliL
MADKQEKKAEAPAAAPAEKAEKKEGGKGKGAIFTKTPFLLGMVMVIEAAIIFTGVKLFGGSPKQVEGAELALPAKGEGDGHGGEGGAALDKKAPVEIPVLSMRAPNKLSGKTFIYDVSIFALTRAEHEEHVRNTLKAREASIKDRIRTIIAQSDPDKLGGGSEPGLETLRRQVKHQLDEIIGEKIIDEVLIDKCTPFRADF